MIYLCCDTNIWINISNGFEPTRLLDRLYDEIQDRNIKLILPEVIITEWVRNKKPRIVEKINEDTKTQITSLTKLSEFLEINEGLMNFADWTLDYMVAEVNGELSPDPTLEIRKKVVALIADLKEHRSKIETTAKNNIRLVENIFQHSNTEILPTDEKTSKIVMEMAINHQFPFNKDKNNFADCLIFHQYFNYIKEKDIKGAHFVTANRKEFFPKKRLHEYFNKIVTETDSFFHPSLTEALSKSLNEQLVSLREAKLMKEIEYAESMDDLGDCECCSEAIFINSKMDVIDNRPAADPKQMSMFKTEEKIFVDSPLVEIQCAVCENCDTLSICCPECSNILAFFNDRYWMNTYQECENCGMKFIMHERYNNEEEIIYEFEILEEDYEEK